MSLDLTYADNADAVLRFKNKRRVNRAKVVLAVTLLLLLAAAFGVLNIDPITTPPWA